MKKANLGPRTYYCSLHENRVATHVCLEEFCFSCAHCKEHHSNHKIFPIEACMQNKESGLTQNQQNGIQELEKIEGALKRLEDELLKEFLGKTEGLLDYIDNSSKPLNQL